jgi:SAM-dependent methyltransferase
MTTKIDRQKAGVRAASDSIMLKACFDEIYSQDDPREYYRVLYGLDYIIPDLARGIFRQSIAALEQIRGRPLKVLDLGCSYGNNAALLRLPLDLARLAQRYADLADLGLSSSELASLDRHYFKGWPQRPMTIVGLDVSEPAIRYAKSVGILDDGIAIDLESGELTPAARDMLRDVDLIVSTGCIGYVTERTFEKVLSAIEGPRPWVASFVLRMYPFQPIESSLSQLGLTTEKLDGITFIQRRFYSKQECSEVLSKLEELGLTTDEKETEGLLHAEYFLSRPDSDIARFSLQDVANVTTGEQHAFGRRYRRDSENVIRLTR